MGQLCFQNRSIKIEVVRLDRFPLPHSSDDCSSKSLRRGFVTPFLAIICDYQSFSKCIPFDQVPALFVQ